MPHFLKKIKWKALKLKQEIVFIFYALGDKRTPFAAKFFAIITVMYVLSPIDLIPDFIPVLGLLDDIILVPLLIKLTLYFIPNSLLTEIRQSHPPGEKIPRKWFYAIPIIIIYLVFAFLL